MTLPVLRCQHNHIISIMHIYNDERLCITFQIYLNSLYWIEDHYSMSNRKILLKPKFEGKNQSQVDQGTTWYQEDSNLLSIVSYYLLLENLIIILVPLKNVTFSCFDNEYNDQPPIQPFFGTKKSTFVVCNRLHIYANDRDYHYGRSIVFVLAKYNQFFFINRNKRNYLV